MSYDGEPLLVMPWHPSVTYVCDGCYERQAVTWVRVYGRHYGLVCGECCRVALTPGGSLAELGMLADSLDASVLCRESEAD